MQIQIGGTGGKALGIGGGVLFAVALVFVCVDYFVMRGELEVREYATDTLEPREFELEPSSDSSEYLIHLENEDRLQFGIEVTGPDGDTVFTWEDPRRMRGERYVRFSTRSAAPLTLRWFRTGEHALVDLGPAWIRVYENDRRIGPKLFRRLN